MNDHYTPTVMASLATLLTGRDRSLLRLVWDHTVLTGHQLTRIAFNDPTTARHRLLKLHRLGVLDRFRPKPPLGTAPWHYVLGEPGAAVLATEDGIGLREFGYRRDRTMAIAFSQRLAHTVGTNEVFARLYGNARQSDGCRLSTWWPEARCAAQWGKHARPDAYARWTENGRPLDFFLEYDTGTETLDRVAAKLHGYAALASATGITTPVLFLTSSTRREANLHARLQMCAAQAGVPCATAVRSPAPEGAIWLPHNRREGRLRLAELADHWPPASSEESK
ncbi:replication-relaxation family protein [Spongiactinospora sp. TRM90649]|uniref:replication-relaxation family protein n=1 Tax=Spongiactinospora sp. TRM90649 TaxID=3031114 RepID=UPI0023F7E90E|nr:replication-relaxation family protein [Spongiactinospora sp. TRM90649]MDF5758440.1 replication-relaxation family protein [Spongiactinospora sp. TRM90649]